MPEPTVRKASGPAFTADYRRIALGIGAAVLAVVIIGGGAFAAVRLWPSPGVNPAERLPDSAVYYAEINLDPGSDQTRMFMSLAEKFDLFDGAFDLDTVTTDLMEGLDIDGVASGDLTGWLGTRAAFAVWYDSIEEPYVAVALASRDDGAAEEGLANIRDTVDDDFGYVVDDGLAVLLFAESGAQDRAESLVAEGREAPLADSEQFRSDVQWLDGDHFALFWGNEEKLSDLTDEAMALTPGLDGMQLDALSELTYSGEASVAAIRATDGGIEMRYRAHGDDGGRAGLGNWREMLGGLRTPQVAALLRIPDDLTALSEPLATVLDQAYGPPVGIDSFTRGQWDYELAMTDEEHDEYQALLERWSSGELTEGDPGFNRLLDLNDRFFLFGLQREYDEWVAAGGESEQRWRFENALTHEEFDELITLGPGATDGTLTDEEHDRFAQLDGRLYAFGVVSDYEFYEPPPAAGAVVEEMSGLLSGAIVTLAGGDLLTDPDFGVAVTFADGPADRVLDLPIPDLEQLLADLGDDLVFDGPTLTYGDLEGSGEQLADHPRFDEAFAGMPDQAAFTLFVDVAALNAEAQETEDWLAPISTLSWVHGEGSGMIRVLID